MIKGAPINSLPLRGYLEHGALSALSPNKCGVPGNSLAHITTDSMELLPLCHQMNEGSPANSLVWIGHPEH